MRNFFLIFLAACGTPTVDDLPISSGKKADTVQPTTGGDINDGWAQFPLRNETFAVTFDPNAALTRVIDVVWDQCNVELPSVHVNQYATLHTEPLANLRDGDCTEVRHALIDAAAGKRIAATLHVEVNEYIEWGTGTGHPACQARIMQNVYLDGALVPNQTYSTQAELYLQPMTLDDCWKMYGKP